MIRGLVLEGGGAKGAYAIGVMLAFQDKGLAFDVVSGTSVGALNAVLVSINQVQKGTHFWENLSFKKVCKPTHRIIIWILLPVHLVAMFLHHVPFIGHPPFSTRQSPKKGYESIIISLGIPNVFIWLIYLVCLCFIKEPINYFLRFTLILTGLMLLLGIIWAIPYLFRSKNLSLFTIEPLRNSIIDIFQGETLNIPKYATLTEEREMFDPDNPGFYHIGGEFGYSRDAISQQEYVPHYIKLNNLSQDRLIDVLVASAAIPFGLFPSVAFGDKDFIDGGVADNIPLFPLTKYHNCDEIYVVRLRPNKNNEISKNWEVVDRRIRVSEMNQAYCQSLYREAMKKKRISNNIDEEINPPENVPLQPCPYDSSKIVVISPSKSLGSFLSGTMNFNGKYTRRLVKQGYRDALISMKVQ